ncbi:hypothetical protein FPV67DRAFT_1530565 [Lyophyllum atratum]|nr:hypothetical protein FPV67DRAFT_1530565 [Lyophyllum atratum]
MPSGYIPPHRRNVAAPATLVLRGRRYAYTNEEIVSRLNLVSNSHTLRGRDDKSLSAIVVPAYAHPDYHSTASQLFCHSNLRMLEGSIGNEYPVFESTRNAPGSPSPWARRSTRETFEFAGWVRIAEVVYHEPHTPELIAMLERKFGNKARSEDNWRKSLHMRWAVVTVEKVEGRDTNPML